MGSLLCWESGGVGGGGAENGANTKRMSIYQGLEVLGGNAQAHQAVAFLLRDLKMGGRRRPQGITLGLF